MATSTLTNNRASTEGANIYLGAGSTTTYVLPAPPGYWVPATKCDVWREACDRGDSACQAAAASCKANPTDNVDNYNVAPSSCAPVTFNQPCDWQNSPALLGKTVYVLPLGSHDLNYPFACAAGVLGGNGSRSNQQTSAMCAGLCPAGFTCGAEATVTPAACPKGHYCPKGTSVALPCLPGSYSGTTSLTSRSECTETDKGHFAPTGSTEQTPCSPGTVAPNASMGACLKCEAGTFQATPGQLVCGSCPISSWCAAGSSAPTACEGKVGRSENLTSASDCEACPMGSWCSAGLAVECGVNTYQPLVDQIYAGACLQCPRSAESGKRSATIEDCKCQETYYDSEPAAGNVTCKPCPFGSECKGSGSTLALLPLVPGYWRTHDDSSDLRRCPDASSPDTTACANTNGVLCKPWTTGPYCRVCNVTDGSRYFDSGQSACMQCGDTAATSLAALVGITAAVLFLFCWCSVRQPCKRLRNLAYQALLKTRAPLKQMITFYQARGSCDLCSLPLDPPLTATPREAPPLHCTDRDERRGRLQGFDASIRRFIAWSV
eukprot:scaffold2717_cov67-Phaeocystis_antarctica.AAC.4